jgi:hypothetical protein
MLRNLILLLLFFSSAPAENLFSDVPSDHWAYYYIWYGENFSFTPTQDFSDVPSPHGFFKYVQKLKDDHITAVSGTYGVDNIVTRAQMAAFLSRAFLGTQ